MRRLPVRLGQASTTGAAPAHGRSPAAGGYVPSLASPGRVSAELRVGEPDALAPQAETGDSLAHINAHKELEKLLTRHRQLGRGDRRVTRCCRCQSEGTDARVRVWWCYWSRGCGYCAARC